MNEKPGPALFGSPVWKWSALRPLVLLAALFAAELVCLSIWLDTATLSHQGTLLVAIASFGPRILRVVVGFSLLFVTFAFLRGPALPSPGLRIRWSLLSLHAAGMLGFAGLSFLLFARRLPAPASNLAALCWLGAGLSAILLAAVAFIPLDAWIRMVRSTGFLWVYALSAAIAVSFAGDIAALAWQPLWRLTFRLVQTMLGLFVSPVVVDPATLIVSAPHFSVQISPECAGFEGIGLILAFGLVWLLLFRKECRFPQALLLLPAGVVFIYLLNAIRITALLLIGNAGAPRIAVGGFHSQAGWIAFAVASLGFCSAARRLSWIAVQPVDAIPASERTNPTAAYLMPFLAILAAGMLATALSAGFEWLYCLRFFAAAAALWFYRTSYRTLDWRTSWRGPAAGAALFFAWIAMDRWSGAPASHTMPATLAAAPAGLGIAWLFFRAIAAVVTVPIAEELAFRGFLLRRLTAPDFERVKWSAVTWTALAASSLLFGLLHGRRWPAGVLAGLLFGWLAMRQRKIGEAVAAHAATNALIAIYVLAAGQWQLW
jgi:exosortase E/protease (VPEID-CTERM system)